MTTTPLAPAALAGRYVDLLEEVLTFSLWDGRDGVRWNGGPGSKTVKAFLRRHDLEIVRMTTPEARTSGEDWPRLAHTMIGRKRIENLRCCVETVLADGVAGDLIETGVWRGGSCIFMRGILAAHEVTDRTVWVADSFAGLPAPDAERYPADAGDPHHTFDDLAVPLTEVQRNFQRYGLLDDQVRFLPGWFADTLPAAPIDSLAVIRLDGDMYSSTIEALTTLYPKLAVGGFCIVDDYGAVDGCRRAVDDYRTAEGITAPLVAIDACGSYWRR